MPPGAKLKPGWEEAPESPAVLDSASLPAVARSIEGEETTEASSRRADHSRSRALPIPAKSSRCAASAISSSELRPSVSVVKEMATGTPAESASCRR